MGAMRMGNKHLSDTIQVCNWVIENTDSSHSKNIMARGLVNRIQKFIHQTGRDKAITNHIKQDTETAIHHSSLPIHMSYRSCQIFFP